MVKIADVEKGTALFLDNEIFAQIKSSDMKKYGMCVASAVAVKGLGAAINKIKEKYPFIELTGIIVGDEIDLDFLVSVLKAKMPDTGVSGVFPIVGSVGIDKGDIDKLKMYIEGVVANG